MNITEKYGWASFFAVQFGAMFLLMGIFSLSKSDAGIHGFIAGSTMLGFLLLMLLFRIVYLKGKNSHD